MKKNRVWIVCLLAVSVFLMFCASEKNRKSVIGTFDINAVTKEEITDELVVALFMEEIRKEIAAFYSEYDSGEATVYNYEVTVAEIGKKEPGVIFVKFGVTPQTGAHNPLGYDELGYEVDSGGKKSLVEYKHLKNFDVSE